MATDELALQGARVSATIELSISPQWNIQLPATEAFKSIYKCGLAHTQYALRPVLDFAPFLAANAISII